MGALGQQFAGGSFSTLQPAGSGGGGGSGTVTDVSVVSANGLAGSVANPTTTPAITLSTTITGILSGNGTAISAASTTGSGSVVLATSPTLVTPALGTPTALVGTNITGTAAGLTAGNVTTNANLTGPITSVGNATALAAQTGTGSVFVVQNTPTLTTPVLGVATATSINKVAITAPATSATLTIADGKTLTASNSITIAGTDSTVMTFPTTSATIARTDAGQTFTGVQAMTSPDITTSLTTPSTTFSLLNATATTINFAGASGAVVNFGGGANAAELRFLEPSGSGTNYTAFKAQAQSADVTYTLPNAVGAAGAALTDAAGNGTLSWVVPSGFSYGASISGTTDAGVTVTLSNSSNDGAAALKLVAGNTQGNQPVLANLQVGTSANVQGLLIQGTGGSTAGAAGTGNVLLTLWANTAASTAPVLNIGNGTSYTANFTVLANGSTTINSPTDNRAITINAPASMDDGIDIVKVTASNTNSNQIACLNLAIGTSANAMGLLIKGTGSSTAGDVGTGSNHATLWANVNNSTVKVLAIGNGTSYTERFSVLANGAVTAACAESSTVVGAFSCTLNNSGQSSIITASATGTGFDTTSGMIQVFNNSSATRASCGLFIDINGEGTLIAATDANVNSITANMDRQHTAASTITDTDGTATGKFSRLLRSGNASANFTNNTPNFIITQTATQTSGTLVCSGVGLQLIHNSRAASTRTWAMSIQHDNAASSATACGIDLSSFSVDEPLFKFVADAITVAGTVSHQFAVDVGGTTFYLVGYTHGT